MEVDPLAQIAAGNINITSSPEADHQSILRCRMGTIGTRVRVFVYLTSTTSVFGLQLLRRLTLLRTSSTPALLKVAAAWPRVRPRRTVSRISAPIRPSETLRHAGGDEFLCS